MQVQRLLARVAAKDAEFSKERAMWQAKVRKLEGELRDMRKAAKK